MIYSISINNFKSIKKASIKLPTFGAIVGRNAAGKTNLIQAIKLIRDLSLGKNTAEAQKSISLIPNELFNFNEGNTEFTIDTTLQLKDESKYLLGVKIGLINGTIKPAILNVNEEKLYKINDDSKEEIYIRDTAGLRGRDNSVIPLNVDNNRLALAVYKTHETEIVKDSFNKTVIPDIDTIELESITTGNVEDEFENLASIIVNLHRSNPEKYDNFQTIIKKIMPHFSSVIEIPSKSGDINQSPEKESYLIVLEEQNLKQKISMQSVSSGDLKTLYLIATTLSMEDHSVLLVEEIENGMHPKRIVDLIDHLETISKIKKMQIVFTTHSTVVINRLSAHEVVLTHKDAENGTEFTLLEDTEQIGKIKKYLQEGGNLTDYLYTTHY